MRRFMLLMVMFLIGSVNYVQAQEPNCDLAALITKYRELLDSAQTIADLNILNEMMNSELHICNSIPIAYGDEVKATLPPDEVIQYRFQGEAGDIITVRAARSNGQADLVLELQDFDGMLLASDDDSNPEGTLNPMITGIPLSENGTYIVVVSRVFDDSEPSEFILALEESGPPADYLQPGSMLAYGTTGTSYLFSGQPTEFFFVAESGDIVNIGAVLQTGYADLVIEVYDQNNNLLDEDDDSNPEGSFNPLLADLSIPYAGTYRIVVRRLSFSPEETPVSFQLALNKR